ncbi:nuclear transport factor 2 family protein [Sphingomonas sp. LR61]|uniref:nuclear transport factor 2 family protein n=1 Tax=Sphingomonas sp. LR61 TaxID=3050234 RepID=UPI003FA68332
MQRLGRTPVRPRPPFHDDEQESHARLHRARRHPLRRPDPEPSSPIGRVAIAQENAAALRDYFSEDFAFHSPDGELDFAGLETFFSQMRDAFADYYCERYEIVPNGALIGCRTEMGGVFTAPFEPTPFGTVQPHGRRVTLTLINMFRYDEHGKLAGGVGAVRQPRVDAPARCHRDTGTLGSAAAGLPEHHECQQSCCSRPTSERL